MRTPVREGDMSAFEARGLTAVSGAIKQPFNLISSSLHPVKEKKRNSCLIDRLERLPA